MLACLALTAVALFTPGKKSCKIAISFAGWTIDTATNKKAAYSTGEGLMSYSCAKFFKNDDCSDWWDVSNLL